MDAAACERFIADRLDEGAAQTTVKKELRACGAMLRHARRSGFYTRDVEAVIPELEDTYRPRERFLAPLELVALCNTLPREQAAFVVFIVATGARLGEAIRAQRVDLDGHMVRLRGTKTKLAARVVPVPPTMWGALAWSLANTPPRHTLGGELFAVGKNIRWNLARACDRLGMARVSPNDLRRTFASWLRASGLSTDLIGAALGHTTSRMADRVYGRISPEELGRLIADRGPALQLGNGKAA